jgi:signal peptidase
MLNWFPLTRVSAYEPGRALRFAGTLCFGLVLALFALLTVPVVLSFFGYRVYVVSGGSMGSALPIGSIAVAKTVDSYSLGTGDVIAINKAGARTPVLHRIVDTTVGEAGVTYVTQGDVNASPDPEPVTLGGSGDKVVFDIRYVGYVVHFARSTVGRLLFLGMPLALLAVMALWHLGQSTIRRLHAR